MPKLTQDDCYIHKGRPFDHVCLGGMYALSKDVLKAKKLVCQHQRASTSFIQRQLATSYNRAAIIMQILENCEVVSKPNHVGKRDAILPRKEGQEVL